MASVESGTGTVSGSSGHKSRSAAGSPGVSASAPMAEATAGKSPVLVAVTVTSAARVALVPAVRPCPLTCQPWLPTCGEAATIAPSSAYSTTCTVRGCTRRQVSGRASASPCSVVGRLHRPPGPYAVVGRRRRDRSRSGLAAPRFRARPPGCSAGWLTSWHPWSSRAGHDWPVTRHAVLLVGRNHDWYQVSEQTHYQADVRNGRRALRRLANSARTPGNFVTRRPAGQIGCTVRGAPIDRRPDRGWRTADKIGPCSRTGSLGPTARRGR